MFHVKPKGEPERESFGAKDTRPNSATMFNMPGQDMQEKAAAIRSVIPMPPSDIAPLAKMFAGLATRLWDKYLPAVVEIRQNAVPEKIVAKGRFIGEMYVRACYSMLLVSSNGPVILAAPIRAAAVLPVSRKTSLRLGTTFFASLEYLLPAAFHRQMLLMSALMGMLDPVLDSAMTVGEAAALRIAALFGSGCPAPSWLRKGCFGVSCRMYTKGRPHGRSAIGNTCYSPQYTPIATRNCLRSIKFQILPEWVTV